jgi:tetratricopeptide (TPR) repeat protein
VRRALPVAVVTLLAAIAAPMAAIAQSGVERIDPNPGVTFERLTLMAEDPLDPFADEPRLPPEDEVRLARALTLVRASRADEGLVELRELIARHPQSRRIVSASAMALTRAGRAEDAVAILDQAVSRQKVEWLREAAEPAEPPPGEGETPRRRTVNAPRSARDLYARERAEALLALGEVERALPYAVASCDLHPRVSGRLRGLLFDWAGHPEIANKTVEAAEKRSDAAPDRIELAMLAAEIEVRAGRAPQAWERLRRTESRIGESLRGRLVRVLAQRLSADATAPPVLAASAWMELARGPYDDRLRIDAIQRLLVPDPVAAGAPAGSGRDGSRAGAPRTTAPPAGLTELETAWRALPAGDDRTRTGLLLLEEAEARGEPAVASRVRAELAKAVPGAGLAGALSVQRGLAALERGDLDAARRGFDEARASEPQGSAADQAEYLLAEIEFYTGRFDSALAGYDAFARAHPSSPLANDALDRAYLLEAGAGAAVPGLTKLAEGLFAERRLQWDDAARQARDADAEAAAAPADTAAPPPPVRAQALLLLSRAEEARGANDAALAAALLCADSLADDRLAPAARKRAGDLLLAQGRTAEALRQYEELLARSPRSWLASEVRRRVDTMRGAGNP